MAAANRASGGAGGPAVSSLDERGDQECHSRPKRCDAGEIKPGPRGRARLGQPCRGRHQSASGRRLEPEPSAPADRRRQPRTGERADRDSRAHGRAPNSRRACTRGTGGKRAADRAEAGGQDAATGHALQHSSRDEYLHARCERGEGARGGQQPGAASKNAPVTEVIGQRAGGQQSGGEAQAHAAEPPRLAGDTGVKCADAVADVDHERGEHGHYQRRTRRRDQQSPRRRAGGIPRVVAGLARHHATSPTVRPA